MAKTGFPFYKAETDRFQDIKIKRLKNEFKGNGYSVYQYILNEIYRVKGCFIEWDESTAYDVADYWGLKESLVKEIVNYCCAVGLFDKELFTNGNILTSRSIQSRYIDMCKLTKRTPKIPEKVYLLSEEVDKNSDKSQITQSFQDKNRIENNRLEQNREYTPSIPLGKEEDYFSSLSQKDGIPRNVKGLMESLKSIKVCRPEDDIIIRMSNNGEIGHPIWELIDRVRSSKGGIRMPGKWLISELKKIR